MLLQEVRQVSGSKVVEGVGKLSDDGVRGSDHVERFLRKTPRRRALLRMTKGFDLVLEPETSGKMIFLEYFLGAPAQLGPTSGRQQWERASITLRLEEKTSC